MASPQYYNIQNPEEGAAFAPYSGQTSMSAAAANAATAAYATAVATGENANVHGKPAAADPRVKEGFDLEDLKNRLVDDPKYDMSNNLLNFPQGHPLYVPQTLADTYSSDSKSLMDMEELVMGFALLGGVSILVVGLLLNQGIVGPTSAAASGSST